MWEESGEKNKPLRTGLTTGTCATACASACARFLLSGQVSNTVSVTLPKGKVVELYVNTQALNHSDTNISNQHDKNYHARSSTVKNAGDDPDVTHGATIFVLLRLTKTPGIELFAGEGVGTVTREGLALAVGEPAINPVPRQMITEHLNKLSQEHHYLGGYALAVGVENGEAIALKTMNARLGIIGGLSILGTTGIVRPFSCAAWIASITQGIDVAKANDIAHIAATTGNRSEHAIKTCYQMEDMALIEMGDFAGAVLKHLKKHPLKKLSICGGFGKITKLAKGHMDLHSRASSIDFHYIAKIAAQQGANASLVDAIKQANTSIEALNLCQAENVDLANAICAAARSVAQTKLDTGTTNIEVEVLVINRQGEFVGYAGKGKSPMPQSGLS